MKLKLNWESALLALLIVEILLFGALNPRMLDLNMLLLAPATLSASASSRCR